MRVNVAINKVIMFEDKDGTLLMKLWYGKTVVGDKSRGRLWPRIII